MDYEKIKGFLKGPVGLEMATFNKDLSLNLDELRKNIQYIFDKGMKNGKGFIIVPCGTGEYVTLNNDEHFQMVETAVRSTEGELPVVAGIGTCNFQEAIALANQSKKAGAICVMIPPPFYYKIDEEAFYNWYRILNDSVDIPIMVYDQCWRQELGTGISLKLIGRLLNLPKVISLKYGAPSQFMEMIPALDNYSDKFAFIDNSLGFTSTIGHMHGGAGFISGPSTWWPEFELKYWNLLETNQYQEADKFHSRLEPYMKFFYGDEFSGEYSYFHASTVKASLEYVGLYGGPVRPPFRELNKSQKEKLFSVLDSIGGPKDNS